MLAAAGCPVDSGLPVPGRASQRSTPTLASWLHRIMPLRGRQQLLQGTILAVTQALVQAALAERAQAAARGEAPGLIALNTAAEALNNELWRLPVLMEVSCIVLLASCYAQGFIYIGLKHGANSRAL